MWMWWCTHLFQKAHMHSNKDYCTSDNTPFSESRQALYIYIYLNQDNETFYFTSTQAWCVWTETIKHCMSESRQALHIWIRTMKPFTFHQHKPDASDWRPLNIACLNQDKPYIFESGQLSLLLYINTSLMRLNERTPLNSACLTRCNKPNSFNTSMKTNHTLNDLGLDLIPGQLIRYIAN